MSVQAFKSFLEATGHTVLQDENAFWYDSGMRFMIAFPFNRVLDASQVTMSRTLGKYAAGARFLCKEGQGRQSWTIVCERPDYGLDQLNAKTRYNVRRGLQNYTVGKISVDELLSSGLQLNIETQKRQGRSIGAGFAQYWKNYFSALATIDGVDIWGAVNEQGLGAYCIAFPMEDVAHLLLLRSADMHLKTHANNALVYGYLRHALVERGLRSVSFGWEPIQGDLRTLLRFKERMGFEKRPANQALVTSLAVGVLLRSPMGALVQALPKKLYSFDRVAKLSGLANWVRQSPPLTFAGGS